MNRIFRDDEYQDLTDYCIKHVLERINDKFNGSILSFGPQRSGKSNLIILGSTIYGDFLNYQNEEVGI